MKNVIQLFLIVFLFVNVSCGDSSAKASKEEKDSSDRMADKKAKEDHPTDHSATTPPDQKYELKSGIITYESTMGGKGMTMKMKQVLYFEDYGKMERREMFISMPGTGAESMNTVTFMRDGYMYTYSPNTKAGTKMKMNAKSAEKEMMFDVEKMKKDYQYKDEGTETICGKTCQVMSVTTPQGDAKISSWSHIPLRMVMTDQKTKNSMDFIATKVEDNADIPSSKFDVPADVKFTEH